MVLLVVSMVVFYYYAAKKKIMGRTDGVAVSIDLHTRPTIYQSC